MNGVVSVAIPGYAPGLAGKIPANTNDMGATSTAATQVLRIPPVVWMFVFLVVGYLGLKMLLED